MKYITFLILGVLVLAACTAPTAPTSGDAKKVLTNLDSNSGSKARAESTKVVPMAELVANVPISHELSNYFGKEGVVNGKHVTWLDAGYVSAGSASSRFEERIELNNYLLGPQTALTMAYLGSLGLSDTTRSEPFGHNYFLPAMPDSIKYYIQFDNPSIFTSGKISEDNPLILDFLGKELKIVGNDLDSITVRSGTETTLSAGETFVIHDSQNNEKRITYVRSAGGTPINVVSTAYFIYNGTNESTPFKLLEGDSFSRNGETIIMQNIYDSEGSEFDSVEFTYLFNGTNATILWDAGDSLSFGGGDLLFTHSESTENGSLSPLRAVVEVNGVTDVIDLYQEEEISGVSVYVLDVVNNEGVEDDSGTLLVSTEAIEAAYDKGDAFIGEDLDDPVWEWNIDLSKGIIGASFALSLNTANEDDNPMYERPIYPGEEYILPFDFAALSFDYVNVIAYNSYTTEVENEDLYDGTGQQEMYVDAGVLKFTSSELNKGFVVNGVETESVALKPTLDGGILVFRKEVDGSKYLVAGGSHGSDALLFQIKNQDNLVDVTGNWAETNNGSLNGTLSMELGLGEVLDLSFFTQNEEFQFLRVGNVDDLTMHNELLSNYGVHITSRNADLMTQYGYIIENIEYNLGNDILVFQVPNVEPEARIKLYQPGTVSPEPSPNPTPVRDLPNLNMEP